PLGRPEGFNRCVGRLTLEVIAMQAQYVLPLVDISKLQSPDLADRIEVANALDQACKEVGFLYLQGSQFNFDYAKALIEMAQSYFSQYLDTKMQHYIGKSKNHSGYVSIGEEQFACNSYDLKEAYDINYDYHGAQTYCPLLVSTLWPDHPDFMS